MTEKQTDDMRDAHEGGNAATEGDATAPVVPATNDSVAQSIQNDSADSLIGFSLPLPDNAQWAKSANDFSTVPRSNEVPIHLLNHAEHARGKFEFDSLPVIPDLHFEERIGKGGMGVVYRALDLKLNRNVAVKFLRQSNFAGEAELARFQKEAETNARFSHNNIVQVYSCGVANGQPYLVQEYIAGGSLAARLRETPMPVALAAQWLSVLARAVAAAHRSGIVHRDIKPSNVLLAFSDSPNKPQAVPKLTDFGLAKDIDRDETQTGADFLIGTPGYLPSEQCGQALQLIGPASDVFSLGATLYDMLTGRPPFRGSTPLETIELTRMRDPVAPSSLRAGIARDLDTICLKCLEKDPSRRYGSADELADDLDHFLAGEPILARPISRAAKLWKWSKRRPALAAISLVLMASIAAILIGTIVYNRKLQSALKDVTEQSNIANTAKNLAQKKQALAERNLGVALDVIEQFVTRFGEGGVAEIPEMQQIRAQLATDAVKFLNEFSADEETASDRTMLDLGQAYVRVGVMENSIDQRTSGQQHVERGIEIFSSLLRKAPQDFETRYRLANARGFLGTILRQQAKNSVVAELFLQAFETTKSLLSEQPTNGRLRLDNAVWATMHAGFVSEPLRTAQLKYAVESFECLIQDEPSNKHAQLQLASTLQLLAGANLTLGDVAQKQKSLDRARSLLVPLLNDEALQWKARLYLAAVTNSLGLIAQRRLDHKTAQHSFKEAIEQWEKLAAAFPRTAYYPIQATMPMSNLAQLQQSSGAIADAEKTLRQAVQYCEDAAKLDPNGTEVRAKTAHCLAALAALYVTTSRPLLAEKYLPRIDELLTKLCSEYPDNVEYRFIWMVQSLVAGKLFHETNRIELSLKQFERSIEMSKFVRTRDPFRMDVVAYLPLTRAGRASCLRKLGRFQESSDSWAEAATLAFGPQKQTYLTERLVSVAEGGDHRRAFKEIEDRRKGMRQTAESDFDDAALFARCHRAAIADPSLPTPERESLAKQYRQRALDLLKGVRAEKSPKKSVMLLSLTTDPYWQSFRDEPVVKAFIASLQVKPK